MWGRAMASVVDGEWTTPVGGYYAIRNITQILQHT